MNGRTNSTSTGDIGVMDIPLDPPTSFLCEARNSKVDITWVDPKDKYATPEGEQMEDTDQLVSVWAYTKIVRKEGSQPSSPSDGITVYTSDIRNQHQSTIYEDTGVTNGVTYYYAAYAYNTDGIYSDGTFSSGVTPIEWSTVLNENSWEQIDSACTQGVAQSLWEIGDEYSITVANSNLPVVIIDFNHDDLADGSGKAVITFALKNLMNSLNSQNFSSSSFYDANSCGTRDWFDGNLYNSVEEPLHSKLRLVTKTSVEIEYDDEWYYPYDLKSSSTANVYLFPLATAEVFNPLPMGDRGNKIDEILYMEGSWYPYFTTASTRVKLRRNSAEIWFLRTFEYSHYRLYDEYDVLHLLYTCNTDGNKYNTDRYDPCNLGICFGFCVGKSSV